jgi:ubiquinone/menaquinone biosynthesis C-methylase UbiE
VSFQVEDIQKTSFQGQAFDTVFMSLVIHFTKPGRVLAEMHRILKPGGLLIIPNRDPGALSGLDRIRCLIRVISQGLIGYRTRLPKGFGRNVMTEKQLAICSAEQAFDVISSETIKDSSRSSNIPVEYTKAVRN